MGARTDVLVLGGGIIGLSIAYELAKEAVDTLLLDTRSLGSGASGLPVGLVKLQFDTYRGEPFLSLGRASHNMFPALRSELKDQTGLDFKLEQCGLLQLALFENEVARLQREVKEQERLGLLAEWLDHDVLTRDLPGLTPDQFGGILFKEVSQLDSIVFLEAMATAARSRGTRIRENSGPMTVLRNRSRVLGVKLKDEEVTADKVVIAAGAWSAQIVEELGLTLRMTPMRGQLLIFGTGRPIIPYPIMTTHGYVIPKDGYALAGTTDEPVGFDEGTTEEGKMTLRRKAGRLLPSLVESPILGMRAGLRPVTPDELPCLGLVPPYENVFLATGHYIYGILLAPITAKIMAALVKDRPVPLDVSPFSPKRFLARAQ
jgi:glycine oxidase